MFKGKISQITYWYTKEKRQKEETGNKVVEPFKWIGQSSMSRHHKVISIQKQEEADIQFLFRFPKMTRGKRRVHLEFWTLVINWQNDININTAPSYTLLH